LTFGVVYMFVARKDLRVGADDIID
jgi:hypothetical protein